MEWGTLVSWEMGARRGESCDKFLDGDGLDGEETSVGREGEKELGTGLRRTSWRKGEGACLEKEDGRDEGVVGGRDGENELEFLK